MRPFYFGPSDEPLFGILHPPEGRGSRREAVVVCGPFGPEYVRTHRALRGLAQRLARQGFAVLRFDYYGTGDSGGAGEQGTVQHWLEDIGHALEEAREASGGGLLSIAGLRFGAALAALAATSREDIDKMILWDPVVIGSDYLTELAEIHADHVASGPFPGDYEVPDPLNEVLGTPLPDHLRQGMEAVDLRTQARSLAHRTLVITTNPNPAAPELCRRLRESNGTVEHTHQPGPTFWLKQDEISSALVPQATLGAITSWISR